MLTWVNCSGHAKSDIIGDSVGLTDDVASQDLDAVMVVSLAQNEARSKKLSALLNSENSDPQ
jgi:hypothetical protein